MAGPSDDSIQFVHTIPQRHGDLTKNNKTAFKDILDKHDPKSEKEKRKKRRKEKRFQSLVLNHA